MARRRGAEAPPLATERGADGRDDLEAISDYLSMGGHAAFVWPAYAVAAVVMATLLVSSVRGLRARRAELEALQGARAETSAAAVSSDEA